MRNLGKEANDIVDEARGDNATEPYAIQTVKLLALIVVALERIAERLERRPEL